MLFGYSVAFQNLDKTNIEKFGPLGFSVLTNKIAQKTSKIHTGFIYHNLFLIIFGFTLVSFLSFNIYVINDIFISSTFNLLALSYLVFFFYFLIFY